ncbi:hypothetical protein QA597_03610 [Marinilabiliaceae bacterium ANBcel2]|nr:hypothetical protein [Marinilabiliaceae bacterium ANBcel2]
MNKRLIYCMNQQGVNLLRISIGVVYLWFGAIKLIPGASPAIDLVIDTIYLLTFGLIGTEFMIYGLAIWEVIIGLGLLFKKYLSLILTMLFLQMAGTFTTIFLLPDAVFTTFPYGLTMEGQYVFKNIVIISGAVVVGGYYLGGAKNRSKR